MTSEQYIAHEHGLYEQARQRATSYLRDKNLTDREFGTFEDLVETFFGYIIATEELH